MKTILKRFFCVAAMAAVCAFTGAFVSAKPVSAMLSLKCSEYWVDFEKGDGVILYIGDYSVHAKVKSVMCKVFIDCSDMDVYLQDLENPLAQSCRGGLRYVQLEPVEEIATAFVTVEYDDRDVPPIFSSNLKRRMDAGRAIECSCAGKNLMDAARYRGIIDARLWKPPFAKNRGVDCSYRYC